MNLRSYLPDLLRVLLTPSVWTQNDDYNAEWDATLTRLMAAHTFEPNGESKYTIKLGPAVLWVGNHPHRSFMPHDGFPANVDYRPARATILRAADKHWAELGCAPGKLRRIPDYTLTDSP